MPKQTPMSSYEQLVAEVSNDSSFYQVPKEMALKAIHARLTAADWTLWTYVQVFDPHGDRMKQLPEIAKIAQTIGVSERQIQRSLAKLKQLELYDWEPVVIRGQNLAGKKAKELTKQKRDAKSSDESKTTKLSQPRQSCRSQDKVVAARTKLSQPGQSCRDRSLEPSQSNDYNSPQTYSDYSDFIQTLSEGEREIFLEFGRKKAANLPHPPELPDKWIAANFTELYKQFLASSAGREAKQEAIARKYDWENDPRLMDWLHKAYYEGHPWAVENEFEREERLAFLMWAQKTNAYAGRIADEPA